MRWVLGMAAWGLVMEALRLSWTARWFAAPDLMLATVVLVGLSRSATRAALTGLGLGALRDLLGGDPVGTEALVFAGLGWAVASAGRTIYREAAVTQALMMLVGGLWRAVVVFLASTRLDLSGLGAYVLQVGAPSAVLTAVLGPLAYHYLPRGGNPRVLSEHEKRQLLELE